jgi:hypothetical protein
MADYGNDTFIYKFLFKVGESKKAVFDAWVYISPKPMNEAKFKHEDFPSIPMHL